MESDGPMLRLAGCDPHSQDLVDCLRSIFSSRKDTKYVFHLQGAEALKFIDMLDQVLDSPHAAGDDRLKEKCLFALRKVSGKYGVLPSSHVITKNLETNGKWPLSSGGFADVWKGLYGDTQVAIKVFRICHTDDIVKVKKRFCKEAVIWKWLRHPNILPFLGVSYDISQLAIISEWMPHGNIRQYVKSNPETNRLKLLVDVSNGLQFLHSQHIVHGDLKGENILINSDLDACLADFGLASFVYSVQDVTVSVTETTAGTTRWVAPELFNVDSSDGHVVKTRPSEASDIYAFAMVALEVFTGQIPFHKFRNEAVILKVTAGGRPERPSDTLDLGLSDDVWSMMELCWHHQCDERPKIEKVLAHLESIVKDFVPVRYIRPMSVTSTVTDDDVQSESFSLYLSDNQTPDTTSDSREMHSDSNSAHEYSPIRSPTPTMRAEIIPGQVGSEDKENQDVQLPYRPFVTLAVVMTYRTNNNSILREGLEDYKMSGPMPGSFTRENEEPFQCTIRVGRIRQSHQTETLHIMEIDVAELKLSRPSSSVWPESAPSIDGVIVCYDPSDMRSFIHVEPLIHGYQEMRIPTVVFACKSDKDEAVDPSSACIMLQKYQVGLVQEDGKDKMRRCLDWMIRAVSRERTSSPQRQDSDFLNPPSPVTLISPLPANAESSNSDSSQQPQVQSVAYDIPQVYFTPSSPQFSISSAASSSPRLPRKQFGFQPHARSTSEILSERKVGNRVPKRLSRSMSTIDLHEPSSSAASSREDLGVLQSGMGDSHGQISTPWATLCELLDKLVFCAVSGSEQNYVSSFLLTYRCFASPRSVLLALLRWTHQVEHDLSNFALFTHTRICALLSDWIHDYPHDFAVNGTTGALSALVKWITMKSYLLHYVDEFLRFLEVLPTLVDKDSTWTPQMEDYSGRGDDSNSIFDLDEDSRSIASSSSNSRVSPSKKQILRPSTPEDFSGKLKYNFLSNTLVGSGAPGLVSGDSVSSALKYILKKLSKVSRELGEFDSRDIAEEITRIQKQLFIAIKPRHWLRHTLTSSAKYLEKYEIVQFVHMLNHIVQWTASLILCHDKPKSRAKQIEKFIDIGVSLRVLNNYSALRAIVAGINGATLGDETPIEMIRTKNLGVWRLYQSWNMLFTVRYSHRPYRLALRNTKGACIPSLEVHLLDFVHVHKGSPDYDAADPSKINWAKYNHLGKLVANMTQLQEQCQASGEYDFEDRPQIRDLLVEECLLDVEMQKARIDASPTNGEIGGRVQNVPRKTSTSGSTLLRRVLFRSSS